MAHANIDLAAQQQGLFVGAGVYGSIKAEDDESGERHPPERHSPWCHPSDKFTIPIEADAQAGGGQGLEGMRPMFGLRQPPGTPVLHFEICKYCQSTSNVQASALQNLRISCAIVKRRGRCRPCLWGRGGGGGLGRIKC